MKTLTEIQIEYAKSIGFSDWFDLLKHQLNNGLIHRDYNEVAKRYAKQACEDLRERIQKEVQFNCNDIYTINTEIILP